MSSPSDFDRFFHSIYNFAHSTPDRVPLCDWYAFFIFANFFRDKDDRARGLFGHPELILLLLEGGSGGGLRSNTSDWSGEYMVYRLIRRGAPKRIENRDSKAKNKIKTK